MGKNYKNFPRNSLQLPKVLKALCSVALLKGTIETWGPMQTTRRLISEARRNGLYIGHLTEADVLCGQCGHGGQGADTKQTGWTPQGQSDFRMGGQAHERTWCNGGQVVAMANEYRVADK